MPGRPPNTITEGIDPLMSTVTVQRATLPGRSPFIVRGGIPLPVQIATPYRVWLGVHGTIFALLGVTYLVYPHKFESFPVYAAAVGLVPLQFWGAIFVGVAVNAIIAGVVGHTWHCIWSIVAMGFAVGAWSASIFAAVFIMQDMRSPTVLAFALALLADYTLFCFLSIYPRGTIDAPLLEFIPADGD